MLSDLAGKFAGSDSGLHLGQIADADGREVRAKYLRHHPDARQSATVKHGVVPASSSSPGVISLSTTVPAIGERMMASGAGSGPAVLNVLDGLRRTCSETQRLQGGIAVGLGVDRIGFCLRRFALRDAIVLEQILVRIGQPAVGLGGGERLAIGADGGGEVGRIHRRQRIPLLTWSPRRDQQPRHRAGEGRQHAGGLIVVEVHRAGGLDRLAKFGRRDGVQLDVLSLRRRQRHIAAAVRPAARRQLCASSRRHRRSHRHERQRNRGIRSGCRRRHSAEQFIFHVAPSLNSARCHQPPPSA